MKKYIPMDCPVCEQFYFSKLQDGDDFPPTCYHCGWIYDWEQYKNPDLKNGENEMSLNEYREWYKQKLLENPDYDYLEETCPDPVPHKCPVCGRYEFEDESSFDICTYCGWEDDGVQTDDPNYAGGANDLSLNEYKKAYNLALEQKPDYVWDDEPQLLADIIKKHFTKK